MLRRYRAARATWLASLILLGLAAFAPYSNPPQGNGGFGNGGADADSELRRELADANWKPQHAVLDWQALRRFYTGRNFKLAWTSDEQSNEAIRTLGHADHEGLAPASYNASEIHRPNRQNPTSSVHFDLLLTNSMLRYAHDVREGRVAPSRVYSDASLPVQHYDASAELAAALANDSLSGYFASLPPQQEGYRALRTLLARYREIASAGGWPRISGRHARQVLAERLAIEEGGSEPLGQALADFQSHHGLEATGALDAKTIQELNIDAASRAEQIALNMERWRWLPRVQPTRYIEVNVPSASLVVYDGGREVMQSRVVVGREKDPTPLLRANATSITVNPTWEIPEKIARKEILPKLRENPSYLETHHMEFVSQSPLRLRQLPGSENALGALKIEMPNRFNVYLHDTPGQAAFDKVQRDESHGCMRVEQILPLASFALSGNTEAAVPDIQNAIASGETQKIALPSPLAVYVLYWTVTQDNDGKARFWPDPYGRDQQLYDALKNSVGASRVSML